MPEQQSALTVLVLHIIGKINPKPASNSLDDHQDRRYNT